VPIDQCPVLSPALHEAFQILQEMARANNFWPTGLLEIEAFADSDGYEDCVECGVLSGFVKPAKGLIADFKGALPNLESLLLLDQSKNRFELSGPGYLQQTSRRIYVSRESPVVFFR